MKLGIDRLISNAKYKKELKGKRLSLVAHPASVTSGLTHSLQALIDNKFKIVSAFGPQHGLRGEKQDNMIETEDFIDPVYKIPVYSLYGKTRKPTDQSLQDIDVILFDLQDVGTRIYTFLTTLLYMMEACAKNKKSLWVLDRPNPAGRPIEGSLLKPGWESFVGAGPLPMRHGLTLGEAALWFKNHFNLDLDLKIIKMEGYKPDQGPYFGWPLQLSWLNPSPNAATPHMAKCFPGTVLLEGTTLSEGRGTTRALELMGAPDIQIEPILKTMHKLSPAWMKGCLIRSCYFEPTFNKHHKALCQGFQIHVDHPSYKHQLFKPYRLTALFLKALRIHHPDYPLWRDFAYEYEFDRLAIDLINGGPDLRLWVDDLTSKPGDFDQLLIPDEKIWKKQMVKFLLY